MAQGKDFKGRQFTAEVILWVLSGLAPLPLADGSWSGIGPPLTKRGGRRAVYRMRIAGRHGAAGAHRPGLSPVPLSCVRKQFIERSDSLLNRAQHPSDV